ncbi:MAG TPA: YIP1 family protein [Candidatus Obscuribacterales bacterium]
MQDNQPTGSAPEVAPHPIAPGFSPQQIIDQFKVILLSPKIFFANMPLEGGFMQPALLYAVIAGVICVGDMLLHIGHPIAAILGGIGTFITIMLLSFVGAAITMGLSRLLGGTGSYEATYRACAYSAAPHIVGWIPVIQVIGAIYSVFLLKIALERAQNLPSNRAVAVVAIQIGLILIAGIFVMMAGLATMLAVRH